MADIANGMAVKSPPSSLVESDDAEMERMDIKHHIFILLCSGNLHLAPLTKPERILDLGTGTGIWAMEMADQYPESTVIGTDLSPVQPTWYRQILCENWCQADHTDAMAF
ncbi:MAG: hypothetical protein Q9191_000324 [Dirinaria sp. TL-2023a]